MPHRPLTTLICASLRSKVPISPARNRQYQRAGPHGRSQPRQTTDSPRRGRGTRRTEISVDPKTTVSAELPRPGRGRRRRAWRSPAAAAPAPATTAAAGAAAAPPRAAATYWFLTGPPRRGDPPGTVKRFNEANPNTQITATTFQNDAYKTKIKTAIGAGQAPDHHLGLGRRRPEELRRGQPGRGPHPLVRRERRGQGPAVPVVVRRGDGRRQDLRDAGRDGPADRAVLQQEGLRQGRRRSRRSRGATSWTWCRSSTPRASRRSPSAASRAGPT